MASDVIKSTGSVDWSQGCDSLKTPTVASPHNPNGLTAFMLAWLVNATVRGGPIGPRDPFNPKGNISQALGGVNIPGNPEQIVNQPNIPPINTQEQTVNINQPFIIPNVTQTVTIFGPPPAMGQPPYYVGNVGDSVQVLLSPPTVLFVGTVVSWTNSSVTLTCTSTSFGGAPTPAANDYMLNPVSIGPGTPQPPVVIPGTPPTFIPNPSLFQGASIYDPKGVSSVWSPQGTPYILALISGQMVFIDPDFIQPPQNLSNVFGVSMSPTSPKAYFAQAENYLVVQDGTYNPQTGAGTLPLFWDGTNLRQSNGITGILEIGENTPTVYNVTLAAGVVTLSPTSGDQSVLLTLTAPYTGNLWDNVSVSALTGASPVVGIYRVTKISSDGLQIALTTLSSSATSIGSVTASVGYTFTLTDAGIAPGISGVDCAIGSSLWTVPAVGRSVTLQLVEMYPGNIGDQITIHETPTLIGKFQVTGFNASGALTFKTISTTLAGTLIAGGILSVTVNSVRAMVPFIQHDDSQFHTFIVPDIGATEVLFWPRDSSSYPGQIYDNIQLVDLSVGREVVGVFRVVGINAVANSFRYDVTLQALTLNIAPGTNLTNFETQLTLEPPQPSTFQLELAANWIVPPVGVNTAAGLYLFWNYDTGDPNNNDSPMYPGSVGDNITILLNAQVVGTFTVQSFQPNGGIVLQTVSSNNVGTSYPASKQYSVTINSVASSTGSNVNEIPSATAMVYYQGILWYAQGDVVSGGDIVGGPSGTPQNKFLDSVLKVTENPLAFGGDGFKLPIPGNITGMTWPQQQNAALGQGVLYIFTTFGCVSLQVPFSRPNWILATANNQPQMNVVLDTVGSVNDWCLTKINGDIYFQSDDPGIWSIILAQRYFQQWGNILISTNEDRLWNFTDATLLGWVSGIYFQTRMLMTALPKQTPYGVVHQAIIPLDMTTISTLEEQLPPNWEGQYEGLQIFQLLTGKFNRLNRAFAITLNANTSGQIVTNEIDLWEITPNEYFENNGQRIKWQAEFPAFTLEKEFDLKRLVGGELWLDEIRGVVDILVEYRPDSQACWNTWYEVSVCSQVEPPGQTAYPPINFPPGYRSTLPLPDPSQTPQDAPQSGRPATQAFQIQPRITFTGSCKLRGLLLHLTEMSKSIYQGLNTPIGQ